MGKNIYAFLLFMVLIVSINGMVSSGDTVVTYVVRPGDNLSSIAQDFNTTIEALITLNNIGNPNVIRQGQVLAIAKEELVKRFTIYTIKPGDSLYKISQMFEIGIEEICAINHINNPNQIAAGEDLVLPVRSDIIAARAGHVQTIATLTSLSEDVLLLARIIYAEARGEPFSGQVAVGAVVLNRVRSSLFPNTIWEVIYERGQFTPANSPIMNARPSQTAIKAAKAALRGEDTSNGALFFYNPRIATSGWWFEGRPITKTIGNHVFTR